MTFCPFWEGCTKGLTCDRALTSSVKADAKTWWAQWDNEEPASVPICKFTEKPTCFKEKE